MTNSMKKETIFFKIKKVADNVLRLCDVAEKAHTNF